MNSIVSSWSNRKRFSLSRSIGAAVLISLAGATSIAHAQQFIYWEGTGGQLRSADPSDVVGTKHDLFNATDMKIGNTLRAVAIQGKFFWVGGIDPSDISGGHIVRADLDGTHREVIKSPPQFYTRMNGLAVDDVSQLLYFTMSPDDHDSGNPPVLYATSTLGGNVIQTVQGPNVDVAAIAVDHAAGKVCWLTLSAGNILCSDLNLGNLQTVVSGLPMSHSIVIDTAAHKIIWSDQSRIARANLDGSNIETLRLGGNAWELTVDPQAQLLYWIETPNKIMKSNLDGTGLQTVLANSNQVGDSFLNILTLGPGPAVPAVSAWALTVFSLGLITVGTLVLRLKSDWVRIAQQEA